MRVTIDIDGQLVSYEKLAITCTGTKYSNAIQADAVITIANLDTDVRNYILTEGTPFLRDRQQAGRNIIVEAGRSSTDMQLLYIGNIFRATVSDPPEQVISIRAIQHQAAKGRIVSVNYPGQVPLDTIVREVANSIQDLDDEPLMMDNQATDRMIADYSFTGSALEQIKKIQSFGGLDTWIDNNVLYVVDRDRVLQGLTFVLTARNGMIGIPQPTEQGVRVTMMYDSRIQLGSELDLTSDRYPSLTGIYRIYKVAYNLTNRDTPFYLTLDCNRLS